jgi:arylformamidase
MRPIDLSSMRIIDLSQNWDMHTPGFATYEGPCAGYVRRGTHDEIADVIG